MNKLNYLILFIFSINISFGTVSVTFQVDMQFTDPSDGVYIRGGNIGSSMPDVPSMGYQLSDDDGDLVYEATLALDANTHYNYKFATGESWGWEGNWETVPPECGEGPYTDRFFDTGEDDMTFDPVCFGSCEACPDDFITVDITFQVNMAGTEVSPEGVFLHPSWLGWGTIPMNDDDGDCIYEVTVYDMLVGSDGEYLFKNGGANEIVSNECSNVNDWGGGVNRLITFPDEDLTLDPICFGLCEGDACSGECGTGGGTTFTANFAIDLNGSGFPNADYDQCGVNGSWNGWGGWGLVLADDDGDGVYTGSLPDLADGSYEFVVFCSGAGDGWSGWGVVFNAPLGSECDVIPDDEYGNYGFTIAGADVDATYCAGSCDATCDGGGPDGSSLVTFDIDGVDDCGFVSVTGTFDSWSGWGAHTDSNMQAEVPAGDHEFVILCVNTVDGWWYDIWGNSTIINAPVDTDCWNGDYEYANYVFNVDGSGDDLTVAYCAGTCEENCETDNCGSGDPNADGSIDVLDVVTMVSIILGSLEDPTEEQICASDVNVDESVDVLDVVMVVSWILNPREDNASSVTINRDGNEVSFNSNGYVGAIQMTLSHNNSFNIELTDNALVADYHTVGNITMLIIVCPETEHLFSANGHYIIEDVTAATTEGYIDIEMKLPLVYSINSAYPNPFNPSTNLDLEINTDANIKILVYNIMGQIMAVLVDENLSAGSYQFTWHSLDTPSGLYFIKTDVNSITSTQKILLLK